MISASHNPYADNGIKLFGPDGYKLSDEDEAQIEQRLTQEPALAPPGDQLSTPTPSSIPTTSAERMIHADFTFKFPGQSLACLPSKNG
jgi:phosphomannomutase